MAPGPDDVPADPVGSSREAASDPSGTGRSPATRTSRAGSGADAPATGVGAPAFTPSTTARVIGFLAILLAGAAGGFIGYAVTDLQCTGDCTTPRGIGGLVGAVICAVGVAIVVQLALRAMNEWRVIQAAGGPEAERMRQKARERREPPVARPKPRVR